MNLNLDLLEDDAALKLTVAKLKEALKDSYQEGLKKALMELEIAILPPDDLRPKGVLLITHGNFARRLPLDHAVSLRHLSFEANERLLAVFDKDPEPESNGADIEPIVFGIPERLDGVTSLIDKRIQMSVRLRNCLSNDGLDRVGGLREQVSKVMRMTKQELMRIPNFGNASYRELKDVLWDNFCLQHHPNAKY